MPDTIVEQLDARVTSIPPEREPEPAGPREPTAPLRLVIAHMSDEEEFANARLVIAHYVKKFGRDRVRQAVDEIAGGGL